MSAASAGLTPVVGSTHICNLNIIQLLNRVAYLELVRLGVNLERISVSGTRKMHALFCYQRLNYNFVIIHVITCLIFIVIDKTHKRVFCKQHFLLVADVTGIEVSYH
jgi:hypothetical protein